MRKSIILSFILFTGITVFGQTSAEKLTRKLSDLHKKSGFPGFAAAIVDESGVRYQNGFGYADVKRKISYTRATIQPVGSVSKTLIGVALLRAVENGALSLDADVADYLPFAVRNPHFPNEKITLRQLATHTSGIVDREEIYAKTYVQTRSSDVPLESFLADYLTAKGKYYDPFNFAGSRPGAGYNYTNIGATLAAYVVEAKTQISFSRYTREAIFEPLAMTSSGWFYEKKHAARYAVLYDAENKPLRPYSSLTYPDGSLKTSVSDLAKYLHEIIKGAAGSGRILSKESFQILLAKQFAPGQAPQNVSPKEPNQGIFFVHRAGGEIGHTGSDYGVSAFMFFNPVTRTGKIFMTNIDLSENPKLAAQFAEIWKNLELPPS